MKTLAVLAISLAIGSATRFYPTIDLKTAKTLGLPLPMSLLLRADQVIE